MVLSESQLFLFKRFQKDVVDDTKNYTRMIVDGLILVDEHPLLNNNDSECVLFSFLIRIDSWWPSVQLLGKHSWWSCCNHHRLNNLCTRKHEIELSRFFRNSEFEGWFFQRNSFRKFDFHSFSNQQERQQDMVHELSTVWRKSRTLLRGQSHKVEIKWAETLKWNETEVIN